MIRDEKMILIDTTIGTNLTKKIDRRLRNIAEIIRTNDGNLNRQKEQLRYIKEKVARSRILIDIAAECIDNAEAELKNN